MTFKNLNSAFIIDLYFTVIVAVASECFRDIILFTYHSHLIDIGTIVIPFSQMKKLEHRETMSCLPSQGHIANKYGTKIFKPRQYDSNTRSLNLSDMLPFRLLWLVLSLKIFLFLFSMVLVLPLIDFDA